MTTVVINTGTTTEPNDTQLNNETIELGSVAGAAATVVFSGDSGITFSSPTLNQTSVICWFQAISHPAPSLFPAASPAPSASAPACTATR